MESIEELVAHIKSKGHLLEIDGIVYFEKAKVKFREFIVNIEQEGTGTKEAFYLLTESTFKGKTLTAEEKLQVENQMKDTLKTLGLVAITILPGGSLFLVLSTLLKTNKYIIPSSFLKEGK